jgi:hypothetical protein
MSDWTKPLMREALEHLAAEAETQEAYLRRIGTWPMLDELALDLDDVAGASESWPRRSFVNVFAFSPKGWMEMSSQKNAQYWEPRALQEPEWTEVRRLASDALSAFE